MSTINENIHKHSHHEHTHGNGLKGWLKYLPAIISFILLAGGLVLDHYTDFLSSYRRLIWYIIAYLPVGIPVLKEAFESFKAKDFFNEFSLMGLATIGAFCIKEYPEGVAVMLFYSVGELFQDSAVDKAKRNIKALLDIRPDTANVFRNGKFEQVSPNDVSIGETVQVKAGEKVPLDGVMLSAAGSFNTSALTGESKPKTIREGEKVLAGMLNMDTVIEFKVDKNYTDSSLAKILEMVQNATERKAKTELLIKRFAKIYTPIVFGLAVAITLIPFLLVADYVFADWLYRALVFLVISCPCALVVSIPLGYFGGIGAASRQGILFKGANYLDLMTKVNTVVMDKTGTLTKGVFKVQKIVSLEHDEKTFLAYIAAIEKLSNHPIAKAIVEAASSSANDDFKAKNVQEIAGFGLSGTINGKNVLVGNTKLLAKFNINYDRAIEDIADTTIVAAIDQKYMGYLIIADEIKADAKDAIKSMHAEGIQQTVMLSGDKNAITQQIAQQLGIDKAYGDLLPEDKVKQVEKLKSVQSNVVAFVGDGINDAPVLALSDIGIAMGGMGSEAAIEVADVVIQTDQPSKIATAIKIAKATKRIVIQNIVMALGIKIVVMVLGAFGIATMWAAVFADVGVAMLAILNAIRILRMKF